MGVMTYLVVCSPQASLPLSPPHQNLALTLRGRPLPPHQCSPVWGLPVLADGING